MRSLETFLVEWKRGRQSCSSSQSMYLETFLVEWKRVLSQGMVTVPGTLKPS